VTRKKKQEPYQREVKKTETQQSYDTMKKLFVSEIIGKVRKRVEKEEQENIMNLFIMRREEKEI